MASVTSLAEISSVASDTFGDSTGTLRNGRASWLVIEMVLPETCTENCEAPITVARMPAPGS